MTPKYHARSPAYIGCEVCKEWHKLSAFKKWFDENYIEGYELDKDILIEGNKLYSPATCCFVPKEINRLFENKRKFLRYNNDLPIGVQYDKFRDKYLVSISIAKKKKYIGRFDTIEEAYIKYMLERNRLIFNLVEEYYKNGKISKRIYDAIKYRLVIF